MTTYHCLLVCSCGGADDCPLTDYRDDLVAVLHADSEEEARRMYDDFLDSVEYAVPAQSESHEFDTVVVSDDSPPNVDTNILEE